MIHHYRRYLPFALLCTALISTNTFTAEGGWLLSAKKRMLLSRYAYDTYLQKHGLESLLIDEVGRYYNHSPRDAAIAQLLVNAACVRSTSKTKPERRAQVKGLLDNLRKEMGLSNVSPQGVAGYFAQRVNTCIDYAHQIADGTVTFEQLTALCKNAKPPYHYEPSQHAPCDAAFLSDVLAKEPLKPIGELLAMPLEERRALLINEGIAVLAYRFAQDSVCTDPYDSYYAVTGLLDEVVAMRDHDLDFGMKILNTALERWKADLEPYRTTPESFMKLCARARIVAADRAHGYLWHCQSHTAFARSQGTLPTPAKDSGRMDMPDASQDGASTANKPQS